MTSRANLVVSGLTHGYADRVILREITFTAQAGETLCLLGRSGCGKTTLLRLIAGLERPRAGHIAIADQTLTGDNIFIPPEQRGVGLMFQDYALFPHLSALENARFGLKSGASHDPMALLTRVGLAHAARRYPHTLSAGEQQRVALVRALVSEPSVLLMDEPFSNLDAGTRDDVRTLTRALLRETGTTAIIVTHDPIEAMTLADRIVLLNEGRVEQIDTPEQIYQRPTSLYAANYFSDLSELPGQPQPTYVRPHDLQVGTSDSKLIGRVADISYLGETTSLTLTVAGAAHPLRASVRGTVHLSIGQDIGLSYAKENLLVFSHS